MTLNLLAALALSGVWYAAHLGIQAMMPEAVRGSRQPRPRSRWEA